MVCSGGGCVVRNECFTAIVLKGDHLCAYYWQGEATSKSRGNGELRVASKALKASPFFHFLINRSDLIINKQYQGLFEVLDKPDSLLPFFSPIRNHDSLLQPYNLQLVFSSFFSFLLSLLLSDLSRYVSAFFLLLFANPSDQVQIPVVTNT